MDEGGSFMSSLLEKLSTFRINILRLWNYVLVHHFFTNMSWVSCNNCSKFRKYILEKIHGYALKDVVEGYNFSEAKRNKY